MNHATAKAPPAPTKKAPRWRDLTDEQRWSRIYKDREKRAGEVIKSLPEAVALALPPYALHMALEAYSMRTNGSMRPDVHKAIVGSLALVASRLKESQRDGLADKLERHYSLLKSSGFFLDDKEFLYAVAVALLKLAEEYRYPADSPATMAAILLKEDAEQYDDIGVWWLNEAHATRMAQLVFDTLIATGLYGHIKAG